MNALETFFERVDPHIAAPDAFARFVTSAVRVTNPDEFIMLVKHDLQPIFPHGMMLAGLGHAHGNQLTVYQAIGINYPRTYLESLKQPQSASTGPVLQRWLDTREPQVLDLDPPAFPLPDRWLASVRKHNLKNIASHGVRDVNGIGASYFTFSRLPDQPVANVAQRLKLIVPLLHVALTQTYLHKSKNADLASETSALTDRERDILHLLVAGKSNKEIGQVLNRSELTVKTHIQSVFRKLRVGSRVEAASKAVNMARRA